VADVEDGHETEAEATSPVNVAIDEAEDETEAEATSPVKVALDEDNVGEPETTAVEAKDTSDTTPVAEKPDGEEAQRTEEEDPSKLKVVELRVRLQQRGLDSRGTKPVLLARLREAMEQERVAAAEEEEEADDVAEVDNQMEVEKPKEAEKEQAGEAEMEVEAAAKCQEMAAEGTVTMEDVGPEDPLERSLAENLSAQEASGGLGSATNYSAAVAGEMEDVVVSSAWQEARGWEAVRDVYRRACIVHCPRKAVVRMKWAQFEENIGEVEKAREILDQLVAKYPMLLEARMQQIDLERREKNYEVQPFK
jgi:hypothetical protein